MTKEELETLLMIQPAILTGVEVYYNVVSGSRIPVKVTGITMYPPGSLKASLHLVGLYTTSPENKPRQGFFLLREIDIPEIGYFGNQKHYE